MSVDPISLTRDLVRIPSPTGEEAAVVAFMAELLTRLGYNVARLEVTPGRDILYATLESPVLVFTTHLDVVPPHLPVGEDAEWLYGRGTCDAKGLAAAMVAAAERLRDEGEQRIGLLFMVGEETGGDGAQAASALEPKGRFLINGEPTENRLSIGQKGSVCFTLEATGKAAHSAYPEEGRSAIELLLDALERIRALELPSDPLLGDTTLNIGLLAGGVAPNVIPPEASATLLYRTVADPGPLELAVRQAAGPEIRVERRFGFRHVRSTPLPGWDTTTVKFASDLAYQMGPGSIRFAHTAQERIRKADLEAGVECYVRLAKQLLSNRAGNRE
jgi:acetylornithine deacetylase